MEIYYIYKSIIWGGNMYIFPWWFNNNFQGTYDLIFMGEKEDIDFILSF